ncbi:MAG: polysaccharide deacetylase family protein [Candidatus Omnitrophica bacterium]|nr:polysaccharide deacetylase family protein [Candidatus Omnitrophota bacterium]
MNSSQTEVTFRASPDWADVVVLTVDVEDYFMSPESIPCEDWPSYEPMIQVGMDRILNILDEFDVHATFFFLGWVAERWPDLVRCASEKGHEIATHTYDHRYVSTLSQAQFAGSVQKSLAILRKLAPGQPVHGHRAPAFSLNAKKVWQFDILREHGIVYDSSINPHATYLYGDRSALRFPHRLHGLMEIPPGAIEIAGIRLPVGGGGTLRILPEWYLKRARRRHQSEGYAPVIYVHPWEFVPEHPKIKLPLKQHLIHWTGIHTTEKKVRSILSCSRVITMSEYYRRLTG